jgi:hypothetical protein
MSRLARLTISVLAVGLTWISQALPSGETAARAAAVVDVCTGAPGCQQVALVDVDGDGQADQIGVATKSLANGGSITVRVRTATGHTMQTTGRKVFWFSKPYLGAAALDGVKGAEIVVGDTMGANYEQFRVITYRNGALVTLKAPPRVWTKAGMRNATSRWGIDGSYSFNIGVFRSVSAHQGVTLTMKSLARNLSGRGHSGHVTTYRWHAGGWVEVSAKHVRNAADRTAFASGGWHVPGLPHVA